MQLGPFRLNLKLKTIMDAEVEWADIHKGIENPENRTTFRASP